MVKGRGRHDTSSEASYRGFRWLQHCHGQREPSICSQERAPGQGGPEEIEHSQDRPGTSEAGAREMEAARGKGKAKYKQHGLVDEKEERMST